MRDVIAEAREADDRLRSRNRKLADVFDWYRLGAGQVRHRYRMNAIARVLEIQEELRSASPERVEELEAEMAKIASML